MNGAGAEPVVEPRIRLQLLGSLAVVSGESDLTGALSQPKRLALIAWLALARPFGLHHRDTLCALLWPESSDDKARTALRQLALVLRRELGEDVFLAEGDLLGINRDVVWSDAGALLEALESGDDRRAVSLYAGELLPGLHVSEGEGFERWFEQQRAGLRQGVARAAWRLVDGAEARGEVVESRRLAEGAFAIDSTDEAALRRVVSLQARTGDRAAALRTYEAFTRHLREDWNAEPDAQTAELIERIRTGSARNGGGPDALTSASTIASHSVLDAVDSRLPRRPRRRSRTAILVAFLAALGAVAAAAWSNRRSDAGPARWAIALPDSAPLVFVGEATFGLGQPALALSPDGQQVVYVGRQGTGTALYLHHTGTFEVRRLPGTEGAFHPFFSPDGAEVAFFANGRLLRVPLVGGAPTAISDVVEPLGGVWVAQDRIVVAETDGNRLRTFRLGAGVSTSAQTDKVYSPTVLPGGTWLLHLSGGTTTRVLAATSSESGETRYLTRRGPPATSLASPDLLYGDHPMYADGYLVYVAPNEGRLLARRFNPRSLEVTGDAFPVLEGVRVDRAGAQISLAGGNLAYVTGGDSRIRRLVWAGAAGRLDTLPVPPASFGELDISKGGNLLAFQVSTTEGPPELQVWELRDLGRGATERWRPPPVVFPRTSPQEWSPDASWIGVSVAGRSQRIFLRVHRPLGGEVDTLADNFMVNSLTPDGRFALGTTADTLGGDIAVFSIDQRTTTRLRSQAGNQSWPTLSPDGSLLAYVSDESGTWEVYVERYPQLDSRQKVSAAGGLRPLWSPQGDRLYYYSRSTLYAAPVNSRTGSVGTPTRFVSAPQIDVRFAVAPDGNRLLFAVGPPDQTANHIRIIRDLAAELKRAEARIKQ